MSDNQNAAGTTSAAAPTTVQTPAVTPPVTPPAEAKAPEQDPNWLKSRLDRERTKALKDAGFKDEAEAKAAAQAAKDAAEAKKSAEQRAVEAKNEADAAKSREESLKGLAAEMSARMMAGLTAEQQSAVKAIAGDDPAKQFQTIAALQPTWAEKSAADAAAAAPVTTAPAATAPNGNAPAQPPARVTYEQTRASNPFAAAQFGMLNPSVYEPK